MLNELLNNNDLKKLELLCFKTKKLKYGKRQGMHASLKKGSGLEFSDYRAYSEGDSLKNIDWHIYAKTEKLYVKEFKEYQNINVFIYIDSSASMAFDENKNKLKKALSLSASLGYVALINNESLYFATTNGELSPKFSTAKNFQKALSFLDNIKTSNETFFNEKIDYPLSKIKFPGICVCISDFLMPFEKIKETCDKIRSKNLEIKLVNITNKSFFDSFPKDTKTYIDSETNEEKIFDLGNDIKEYYMQNLKKHFKNVQDYAYKHNIDFLSLDENDDIINFLLKNKLCY